MKVLLVSSNLYSQFPACFPNAVGALSAMLKREGHRVEALHLNRKRDLKHLPRLLARFRPQVVGISVVTCETPIIEPVARAAKRHDPSVPVLVGGIHAIVAPESVLRQPEVDAVCCGEGELALLEYLARLEAGEDVTATPNFMFRVDGELKRNDRLSFIADLDSLPPVDRSVTDLQAVIRANNGVLNVIMSRGCPWSCSFCCNYDLRQAGRGRYSRLHSVQRGIADLQQLARDYRFNFVLFRDDTFTWDKAWALEFLAAYRQHFDIPFDVFSREDCLDAELLDALAEAGCRHIFLGLDSGNDFIRNEVLHKEQGNDNLLAVIDYMRQVGIKPMISNIVGLPYETPQHFQDTIELNRRIHRDQVVFSPTCGACPKIWVFTPWPGSDLYRMCQDRGWLEETEAGRRKVYRESVLQMPNFPRAEIERQFRRFRYEVYRPNHPLHALLFLIYDSRAMQTVFERIPMGLIGEVREGVLCLVNRQRRADWLARWGRRLGWRSAADGPLAPAPRPDGAAPIAGNAAPVFRPPDLDRLDARERTTAVHP